MTTIDRDAFEKLSLEIRAELKAWEKRFQDAHDGRKASRNDIKADLVIAARYSEYNRIRDILSGKIASHKEKRVCVETKSLKSPAEGVRILHDSPQEKSSVAVSVSEEVVSSTPTIKRTFIGPTPQKDGIVLGIFDLFPTETPSRSRTILGDIAPNVAATPSRARTSTFDTPRQYEERARGSRTPASSGKRFMLDAFVTPQKRRAEDQATPSSSYKKCLTPAFLRRDNFVMDVINEAPESPHRARPWARRSFGRSLSGMIKDMRKEQEKQADDELDLLRELEEEEAMTAEGRTASSKEQTADAVPEMVVVIEDSQAPGVLDRDGFVQPDVEIEDSEPEAETEMLRKPWKKKGLKRQTRRNNMRPVAKKAQIQPVEIDAPEHEETEEEVVAETQLPEHPLSGEDDGSDYDVALADTSLEVRKVKLRKSAKKAEEKPKTTRKVKADAHANYKALKIKNKNSKGKGRGGRFGRGR